VTSGSPPRFGGKLRLPGPKALYLIVDEMSGAWPEDGGAACDIASCGAKPVHAMFWSAPKRLGWKATAHE
jgi:hypothetical protein